MSTCLCRSRGGDQHGPTFPPIRLREDAARADDRRGGDRLCLAQPGLVHYPHVDAGAQEQPQCKGTKICFA